MAVLIPGLRPLISTESRLRMKGCTLSVQTSFAIRQKSIQRSIWTKPALPPLHHSLRYADRLCDSIALSERVFFFLFLCRRARQAGSFWSSHLLLKRVIFLLSFCAVSWLWMRGCQKRTPGLFSLADSYLKVRTSLKEHFKWQLILIPSVCVFTVLQPFAETWGAINFNRLIPNASWKYCSEGSQRKALTDNLFFELEEAPRQVYLKVNACGLIKRFRDT